MRYFRIMTNTDESPKPSSQSGDSEPGDFTITHCRITSNADDVSTCTEEALRARKSPSAKEGDSDEPTPVMVPTPVMPCGKFCLTFTKVYWKTLVIVLAPILLSFLLFLGGPADMFAPGPDGNKPISDKDRNKLPVELGPAFRCLFVLLLMATYWSTMVLPLPITSLIPIFLMPMLGIMDTESMTKQFFNAANMMFWCGLAFALALEESGGHVRVALRVVLSIGTASVNRILLGVIVVSAFMSLWISNTAVTAMMIPIVIAICDALPSKTKSDSVHLRNIFLIGIAYASSIGGTGVVIGSPPNIVAGKELDDLSFIKEKGESNGKLTFVKYMGFGIPLAVLNTILFWAWLVYSTRFIRLENITKDDLDVEEGDAIENKAVDNAIENVEAEKKNAADAVEERLRKQYNELGKITTYEWTMFILFILLISMWIFQSPKFIEGWADLVKTAFTADNRPNSEKEASWKGYKIQSATPAVFIVIMLFILPQKYTFWPFQPKNKPMQSQPALLTWQKIHQKLPFQVIVLLGGGFALSEGVKTSGLGFVIALKLKSVLGVCPSPVISIVAQLVALIMTQIVSNSATSSILVPVFGAFAQSTGVNPIFYMLPVAIVSSFAFTLPVGTAPNALVFDASKQTMPIGALCKIGAGLLLIHLITMNIFINSLGAWMFDVHSTCHEVWDECPPVP